MRESLDQEIRTLRSLMGSPRDPDGRVFAPLADAYRKAGEFQEALDLLTDGTERHPDFATGHVVATMLHLGRGMRREAEISARRALELDAENVVALSALARLLEEAGETEEAGQVRSTIQLLDPEADEAQVARQEASIARPTSAPRADQAPTAPPPLLDVTPAPAEAEFRIAEPGSAETGMLELHGAQAEEERADAESDLAPVLDFGGTEPTFEVNSEPEMDFGLTALEAAPASEAPAHERDAELLETVMDLAALAPDAEQATADEVVEPSPAVPDALEPTMELSDLAPDPMEPTMELSALAPDEPVMDLGALAPDPEPLMELSALAPDEPEPVLELSALAPDEPEPVLELSALAPDEPEPGEEPVMDLGALAPDEELVMDLAALAPDLHEPVLELSTLAPDPEPSTDDVMELSALAPDPEPAPSSAPSEPVWTRTLAELYVKQGFVDKALEVLRRLHEANPGATDIADRIQALERGEGARPSKDDALARVVSPAESEDEEEVETLARDLAASGDHGHDVDTPFAWAPQERDEDETTDEGPGIGTYFDRLLGWQPRDRS